MELSVVVPVSDEAENIVPLILEIRRALDHVVDYALSYVDDGSTDATPQRLHEARRTVLPALKVLRQKASCGQSTALRTGIRAATAPWVATLDGDGQNDPADIVTLWSEARASAEPVELVMGYRRRRQDTWLRRVSSRIANRVRARILGDSTPDTGCGLKLFQRGVFLELPFFDHMHRFLPALVQRDGGRVVSVPVSHRPRMRGRSHYGGHNRLWDGIVDLLGVLWLQRRMRLAVIEQPLEEMG